jgi:hypothetical protein
MPSERPTGIRGLISGLLGGVRNVLDQFDNVRANPRLVGRGINRLYYRAISDRISEAGIDIFEADWDTLVLLDACRYDLLESVGGLPGPVESRTSQASNTVGFLRANVAGRDLRNTVYITANPQFRKFEADLDATFHAVVDLWKSDWETELNTVPPGAVTDAALDVAETYPNKRLFVHYNQPHVPFIGSTGRETFDLDEITDHPLPFWQQPMTGVWDTEDEMIWEAYRENLELAIPHVERLLDGVRGKTVVTSDHGNVIGERCFPVPIQEYGHPHGIHMSGLMTVPWVEHVQGDRKRVVAEPPTEKQSAGTDATVEDRLKHLGYKE